MYEAGVVTKRQYSIFDEPAVLYVIEHVHDMGLHDCAYTHEQLKEWHAEGKRLQREHKLDQRGQLK